MLSKSSDIATLPVSTRIHFVQKTLEREKSMRNAVLKGKDRLSKVEEIDTCLDYLTHIDAALSTAKLQNASYKALLRCMADAADRHGIQTGNEPIHESVIRALDEAMAIIKGETNG